MNLRQRLVHRRVWFLVPLVAVLVLWWAESQRRSRPDTPTIGARGSVGIGGGR
ncbi:MAG: hypothetical protein AB7T19_11160 [Planctomycetota bacterium]